MNKIVPYKNHYDLVKTISKYSNTVLYISTSIVVLSFGLKNITDSFTSEIDYLLKINCIIVIGYIIVNLIKDYMLFNARRKKRLDYIDNALGSYMTADHSVNYYTNNYIEPGIYKLAVNGFENVFFSLSISKAMLPKKIAINALVFFVFISSAIFGLNNIVVLFIQLALPAFMLQQIFKLVLYINYLDIVFDKYCLVFNDLKENKDYSKKIPEMISNILEYETTLSWANILLCEKKYNEMNPNLSERWDLMKKEYGITD